MKSNKLSLSNILKNSKIDFIALAKYYLFTLGLILISAIIIVSVIGMKLGFDFSGGTVIEAVYGVDADGTVYTEQQAKDVIETAISDYGVTISSYQTEESSWGDRVVFKLTSNSELTSTQLSDLQTSIYTMFSSYDSADVIQSQYVKVYNVEETASSIAAYASIALAVAIVIVAIGVWIRYGLSQALATLIVTIANCVMTFAFVIICRIPVDMSFIASVLSVFILSVLGLLVFFDRLREDTKNQNYKGYTKNQYSNLALRENFTTQFLIFGISLICMILISGLGIASIRTFGLPTLFGLIISGLSVFFMAPYFWTIITFKKLRKQTISK